MAQLTVVGTCAVLAAISAAAIPSAGLVTMVMVMQASPDLPVAHLLHASAVPAPVYHLGCSTMKQMPWNLSGQSLQSRMHCSEQLVHNVHAVVSR